MKLISNFDKRTINNSFKEIENNYDKMSKEELIEVNKNLISMLRKIFFINE